VVFEQSGLKPEKRPKLSDEDVIGIEAGGGRGGGERLEERGGGNKSKGEGEI